MLKKSIFVLILTVAVFGLMFAVPAQAQTDSNQLPGGGYTLPDAEGSATDDGTTTEVVTPEGENQGTQVTDAQRQEFLTGLAAGTALGIIIGGVAVWFMRKN